MFPNEISGDTVEGVLARVPSSCKPREEGICDDRHQRLAQGTVSEFDQTYRTLVEALGRDGAQVFVESTLYTSATDLNMRVSELNAKLRTFCTVKPERCEFIEVIDAVCSHAQSPGDSSLTVDGLHLGIAPATVELGKEALPTLSR
jgi:hypothetical protein